MKEEGKDNEGGRTECLCWLQDNYVAVMKRELAQLLSLIDETSKSIEKDEIEKETGCERVVAATRSCMKRVRKIGGEVLLLLK